MNEKKKKNLYKENRIQKVEVFQADEGCQRREVAVLEAIIGRILFPMSKEDLV